VIEVNALAVLQCQCDSTSCVQLRGRMAATLYTVETQVVVKTHGNGD
jgi:hypothetical protein